MNVQDIMTTFDDSGLLRPVEEVKIRMNDGPTIPGKKAIRFVDDKSYIATVGSNYKVIQNEQVYSKLAQSLVNSAITLDGMEIDVSRSATNARTLAKIVLPEYNVETSPGDSTALQLLVRNSYDGTWKFSLDAGGFRMACANGQIIGNYHNAYANRHTSRFEVESLKEVLLTNLKMFTEMGEKWLAMKGIDITREQAINILLDYLGKELMDPKAQAELVENNRATAFQSLFESWGSYKNEMGSNAFALYNTLTQHATHVQDNKSPADMTVHRGKMVAKTIDKWLPLLEAA